MYSKLKVADGKNLEIVLVSADRSQEVSVYLFDARILPTRACPSWRGQGTRRPAGARGLTRAERDHVHTLALISPCAGQAFDDYFGNLPDASHLSV